MLEEMFIFSDQLKQYNYQLQNRNLQAFRYGLHELLNLEARNYSQRRYDCRDFRVQKPWILCLPSPTKASQSGWYSTNVAGNILGDFRGGQMEKKALSFHNYYHLQFVSKKRHVYFSRINKK